MSEGRRLGTLSVLLVAAAFLCCALLVEAGEPTGEVSSPHDALSCSACHVQGTKPGTPIRCASQDCHAAQAGEFLQSDHDRAHLAGSPDAPRCVDCHRGHRLAVGEEAYRAALDSGADEPCRRCHLPERPSAEAGAMPGARAAAAVGSTAGHDSPGCAGARLSCYGCHGPHEIRSRSDRASPLHRTRIADTCGRCHRPEREAYVSGSHGRGVLADDDVSPTCVSCHGTHQVLLTPPDGQPTSEGRVVFTCAECHEDPTVARRTDLSDAVVEAYERSFHGLAYSHGITDVATCASCHGAHDVLPASDPASRMHPDNLKGVCLECHPGVTESMVAAVRHPSGRPGLRGLLERLRLYYPVAGTAENPLLVSGLSGLVGFLTALFGVGGGFLMTPLLVLIGVPAAVAVATDSAQITAGASAGAVSHSRLGSVDFRMASIIILGGWAGGFVGVRLVHFLRDLGNFDLGLKLVYVLVLGFVGVSMLIEGARTLRGRFQPLERAPARRRRIADRLPLQMRFPRSGVRTSVILLIGAGFLVGLLAALLGVGGGFLMLPTLIFVIGMPTRVAVGTDLFQIVFTAGFVSFMQAMVNQTVDVLLAATLIVGSLIGTRLGVLASRRLKGEQVRAVLAVIVLVVMGLLLAQLMASHGLPVEFAESGGSR